MKGKKQSWLFQRNSEQQYQRVPETYSTAFMCGVQSVMKRNKLLKLFQAVLSNTIASSSNNLPFWIDVGYTQQWKERNSHDCFKTVVEQQYQEFLKLTSCIHVGCTVSDKMKERARIISSSFRATTERVPVTYTTAFMNMYSQQWKERNVQSWLFKAVQSNIIKGSCKLTSCSHVVYMYSQQWKERNSHNCLKQLQSNNGKSSWNVPSTFM